MKLTLDLVPSSSWFNNVRAVVTVQQWDTLRHKVYSKAASVCEICGGVGRNHPVECHEIWHYDDVKLIQRLTGMIALCPNCHMVKHFGLAQIQNREAQALRHLMRVNNITRTEAEAHINDAFQIWQNRSSKSWTLDILHLEEYGIDIKTLR